MNNTILQITLLSLLLSLQSQAASGADDTAHHSHQTPEMSHTKSGANPAESTMSQGMEKVKQNVLAPPASKLTVLDNIPSSGKVREGGYDGRYIMETTSAYDSLADQCAKASRGLVIIDRETWKKCATKTRGLNIN